MTSYNISAPLRAFGIVVGILSTGVFGPHFALADEELSEEQAALESVADTYSDSSESHVQKSQDRKPGSFTPAWVGASLQDNNPNRAFLNDTKTNYDAQDEKKFREWVINPKQALRIRREYDDMVRAYEEREKYSLNSRDEKEKHDGRSSEFTRYFLRHIMNYQVTEGMKKAEKNSNEVRMARRVQNTVQSVVQGATNVTVNESMKMGTRTDLPNQRGSIWMTSSLFNGNVDVDYSSGQAWSLMGNNKKVENSNDVNQQAREKYRDHYIVSLSRDLFWRMTSGLSYGTASTVMTAAVTKYLDDHWRAQVARTKGLNAERSQFQTAEDSLRLLYDFRF